ncbi:hypothetical protein BH09PSE6_BH09PSE6_23060 [soil metagenome]
MAPPEQAPTVVLTRPAGQAVAERAALEAAGFQVVERPAIVIEHCADRAELLALLDRLDAFDLIHFASINAVEALLRAVPEWAARVPAVSTCIAVMGAGTRAALERGWPAATSNLLDGGTAAAIDSETLHRHLLATGLPLDRALLVKGEGGRSWLGDRLAEDGTRVEPVTVYRRLAPVLSQTAADDFVGQLAQPAWLVVSSIEAAVNLAGLMDSIGARLADWRRWPVFASHARVAATLASLGCERVTTIEPGVANLVQTLKSQLLRS